MPPASTGTGPTATTATPTTGTTGAEDGSHGESESSSGDDTQGGSSGGEVQACDAGPAGDEESLLAHRSGFAQAVTGGAAGDHIVLDTLDADAFIAAVSGNEPKWIVFSPGLQGEIVFESNVDIGSNTTIDGRGSDITFTAPNGCHEIRFWGDDHENLIIHNITFSRIGTGDNCGQGFGMAFGAHTVWIDHCTFSENGDESVSTGIGATDLSITFSRFYNTEKGTLLGWGPGYTEDAETRVTIHHSAYLTGPDRSASRIPKLRRGKAHFFNNIVDGWGWSAVETTMNGQSLIEHNFFDGHNDSAPAMVSAADGYDPEGGWICDRDNMIINATAHGPNSGLDCDEVFEASDFYEYEAAPADESLEALVLAHAGRADAPSWCP